MSAAVSVGAFGPIFLESDVDDIVTQLLKDWLPTYLVHFGQERGVPALAAPKPRDYDTAVDPRQWTDQRLPAVIVTASRTVGSPERRSDYTYSAVYHVAVSVVTRGRSADETRRWASTYAGQVRRAICQQAASKHSDGSPKYPPLVEALWRSGQREPVPDATGDGRYLVAGVSEFDITVDDALQWAAGPTAPDQPTYVPYSTITEIDYGLNGETPTPLEDD